MKKKLKKYRAVAAGALLTGAGTGIFSNSIGIFIGPVCSDLGLERGSFTLISSIMLLASMAALPFFGKILAKWDIKLIAAVCAAVCSAVPLGYSFCVSLWQFYLLAAVNGLFVSGITLLTVGAMLERLSIKAGGAVSGAAFAGAGVFSFLSMPLLQRISASFGWRRGYRLQAAMGAAVLAAALLLLERTGPAGRGPSIRDGGPSFIKVLRDGAFLPSAAGLLLANAANLALFNHTAAFLTDTGLSSGAAAFTASLAALFSSASKPLYGLLLDKLGLKYGSCILGAAVSLASAAALLLPHSRAALAAYPVLLSVCACANAIPANAFASRLFPESFTAAASALTLAATAGSAVGPPLAGVIFDRLGSYNVMWYLCAAAGVASAALMSLAAAREKGRK